MKMLQEGQSSKPSLERVIFQTYYEDNPDPEDFREDASRGSTMKQAIHLLEELLFRIVQPTPSL